MNDVFRHVAAVGCLALACAAGQTVDWKGPVIGFLYDAPSRSVRAVVGFPGSSYLGQKIRSDTDKAFVAPGGDAAVVIDEAGVALVRWGGAEGARTFLLPEIGSNVEHVAWPSGGGGLIAYERSARRLRFVSFNEEGILAGNVVQLPLIEGDVTQIAANHDGTEAVVAVRHPERGGLFGVTQSGAVWRLDSVQNPGGVAFARSGSDLYAVDVAKRVIVRFAQGIQGSAEVLRFAGESEPLLDPSAIALSLDGGAMYVTGGADRVLRKYALNSRTLVYEMPLEFVADRLESLDASRSVFALNGRKPGKPLWLLDVRRAMTICFVPAAD